MTEQTVTEQDTETTPLEATGDDLTASTPEVGAPEAEDVETTEDTDDSAEEETFPRSYVEKLRKEAAGYRDRAKDRDDLAARLHAQLVAATGRLADPSDLEFDEAHLDDPDALDQAIEDLLGRKPHLKARKIAGDVGQGATTTASTVDLAGLMRARAN